MYHARVPLHWPLSALVVLLRERRGDDTVVEVLVSTRIQCMKSGRNFVRTYTNCDTCYYHISLADWVSVPSMRVDATLLVLMTIAGCCISAVPRVDRPILPQCIVRRGNTPGSRNFPQVGVRGGGVVHAYETCLVVKCLVGHWSQWNSIHDSFIPIFFHYPSFEDASAKLPYNPMVCLSLCLAVQC